MAADIPPDVEALAKEREMARSARDFTHADELREQIAAAGFDLRDTPDGVVLSPLARFELIDPARLENALTQPASLKHSIHLLYEGFLDDVERFLTGFVHHNDARLAEVVIVDNASGEGDRLRTVVGERARLVHLSAECGWATARNAGLKTARGSLVTLADLSVEPTGDVLAPIEVAFESAGIGIAGPFGLVSHDMRSWRASSTEVCHAIEGYWLSTRREALAQELICEKYRWYRNADIDLSFQIRSLGYEARVVELPLEKHAHRGWEELEPAERDKRSKRNHYTFFGRWKDRPDLLSAVERH